MNTWQFIAFGTVAKQGGFSIQIFTSNNAIDSLTPTSENDGPGSTFNTCEYMLRNMDISTTYNKLLAIRICLL